MLSDVKREFRAEQERLSREFRGSNLAQQLENRRIYGIDEFDRATVAVTGSQDHQSRGIRPGTTASSSTQLKRQDKSFDPTNPNDVRDVRDQLILMRVVDQHIRGNITVGDSETQALLSRAS
jgi:hypothetical protein